MGAFVSKIIPDWILVISLVILLAYTTHTTLKKGIQQYKSESRYFEELKKSELTKVGMGGLCSQKRTLCQHNYAHYAAQLCHIYAEKA